MRKKKIEASETDASTPIPAKKKKEKGIMIVATGHAYTGRMAMNAVISILNADPEAEIALVCDEPALSHIQGLFDLKKYCKVVKAPKEMEKSNLFEMTSRYPEKFAPFERTFYFPCNAMCKPYQPLALDDNFNTDSLISEDNRNYDNTARWHYQKAGVQHPFLKEGKSSWKK